LTVNIWTKPQSGEKKKAVLFWIYGGGFNMGDTAQPTTNGASLANNEDVIVVSANYRINLFGFPGAPPLEHKNPGLLDQRLGVEWTRDNIAAFGGDPERITIYGESAGGASVDLYSYIWTKDPIVNGFIASSGTVSMAAKGNRAQQTTSAASGWYSFTKRLGCGGEEAGAATVECVQKRPMKELLGTTSFGLVGGFRPSPDGQTIFADTMDRAKKGDFIRKVVFILAVLKSVRLTPLFH
jgi:cholinesterase